MVSTCVNRPTSAAKPAQGNVDQKPGTPVKTKLKKTAVGGKHPKKVP